MGVAAVLPLLVQQDPPSLNRRVPGRANRIVPVVAAASRSETAKTETGLAVAEKILVAAALRCRVGFGLEVPSDDVARVRFIITAPGVSGAVGGDDCVAGEC